MSWVEEWNLRTKMMRKEKEEERMIHDLPHKPESTDPAIEEYEVRNYALRRFSNVENWSWGKGKLSRNGD